MILAFDCGGTKLAAGLVDPLTAQVVAQTRCPTPPDARRSFAALVQMGHELTAQRPVQAVGVSFGGPVAPDGRTVRLSMHVPGWEGAPLADWLETAFGVPAALANDGDAAALAEFRFGAGRSSTTMLYVTISTGIGGGLVVNGTLHRGERGWVGEIGHMPLLANGPPCPCGRRGCLESLASGLSVARAMRERGRDVTAEATAALARAGDPVAHEVWSAAIIWLGRGIAGAANLLGPGVVVLGGGLTRAGDLLFVPVRQQVAALALDADLQVVPAQLGDDVGLFGGASVAPGAGGQ